MKIKKTNRKLSINKNTIAALQTVDLNGVKGGGTGFPTTDPTAGTGEICFTYNADCWTKEGPSCVTRVVEC